MRLRRDARAICVILAFLLAGMVSAQDAVFQGVRVALAVGAASEDAETARRVVESSTELYLEREGFVVLPLDLRPDASATGDEPPRALVNAARDRQADFLMVGTTALAGEQAEVALRLYELAGRRLIGEASSSERAGLQLDRAIAGLTAEVLAQARPALEATDAQPRGDAAAPPDATGDPDDAGRPGDEPAGRPRAPRVVSAPPPLDRLIAIDARFVPFVPIDPAADYLSFSHRGASATILVLPFPGDVLGAGVSVRGLLAEAIGVATSAALRVLPFGVTIQLAAPDGGVKPYGRVTGGAALLEATNAILGVFTSIVPYVAAEIGIQAGLFGPFGVQAFVGFDAIFEGSLPVLGFSPGIGLTVGI